MPEDERVRLVKKYRELGGGELLRLYRAPEDLPAGASDALRDELRLRGVDPDSLEATVPKATHSPEDGEPTRGEMDPPEGIDVPEEVRGALREPPVQEPSRGRSDELTAEGRAARPRNPEAGTLASAGLGLAGMVVICSAVYLAFITDAWLAPLLAIAVGMIAVAVSSVLFYKRSRVAVR